MKSRCIVWSTKTSKSESGQRSREEVLNVRLADLLLTKGLDARPEIILRSGKRLPDIIVDLEGVRVILEARSSRQNLLADTSARVTSGICTIAVGILYPPIVRDSIDIASALETARFDIYLVYYERSGLKQVHRTGLTLEELATAIKAARSVQVSDDLTVYHVNRVRDIINELVRGGIRDVDTKSATPLAVSLAKRLGLDAKSKAIRLTDELLRIAVFILFDAMIYQDAVASQYPETVQSLSTKTQHGRRSFLIQNWDEILKIDYEPIFRIAREILDVIPNSEAWNGRLQELSTVAADVRGSGVLAKHDFMGRLFHRILLRTAGESYATYYTALPSAYLAARIAVGLSKNKFASLEQVADLRIADFACGSGTLLSASYTAVRDKFISESIVQPDLDSLHRILVEDTIYGLDVLDYAAHLTLTTLALHRDRQLLTSSNIWRVPVGYNRKTGVHLGSLDLYFQVLTGLTFNQQEQSKSLRSDGLERVNLPNFDLLIMNPPFSRSSGPKVTFGYDLPNKPLLMARMKQIAKEQQFKKMLVAGMGSFFVPLAIQFAKNGGRICFVLPRALLSGVSWQEVRKAVEKSCHIEVIVSNHDPGHASTDENGKKNKRSRGWALSEETDIGEVLFIARKRKKRESGELTRFVNIFHFPENEFEAINMADQVLALSSSDRSSPITYNRQTVAISYCERQTALESFNWLFPCVFAARELNLLITELLRSSVTKPFSTIARSYGCDISAEKQAFTQSAIQTLYPILWTHGIAQNQLFLDMTQVGYGTPKTTVERAKSLFDSKSSSLLIAERPHLKTTCTFAVVSPQRLLATPFWEVRLIDESLNAVVALWLNSTFGILLMLASATSSQGEIFKLKNEQLKALKIIDLQALDLEKVRSFISNRLSVFHNVEKSWIDASFGKGLRYEIDCLFAPVMNRIITPAEYALLATDPIVTHRRRQQATT